MNPVQKKRFIFSAFIIAFLLWMLINQLYINNLMKNGPTQSVNMEILEMARFNRRYQISGIIDEKVTWFTVTYDFYTKAFPGDSVEVTISERNRHVKIINEKKIIRVQK